MNSVVKTNLRRHLLACASLEDFALENPDQNIGDLVHPNFDHKKFCERLNYKYKQAAGVREKIQFSFFLRQNGCPIQDFQEQQSKGVIIEFGVDTGVDTLAAYSDLKAAWYDSKNHRLAEVNIGNGGKVVHQKLFDAVGRVSRNFNVFSHDPPPPPLLGYTLVNIVSIKGISFGIGASRNLASDNFGGPIIYFALELRKLILTSE